MTVTVIEFFDTDAIDNVVSALLCQPEKVIFVTDREKAVKRAILHYQKLASDRNIKVSFEYKKAPAGNLFEIVRILTEIVDTCGDCTFDLTGGDDLFLVAVGMLKERYKEKVSLHRFNINSGRLADCDADGNVISVKQDTLSVEDNIKAYGGTVIYDTEKPNKTHIWDFTDDFCNDIDLMWTICSDESYNWNKSLSVIDYVCSHYIDKDNMLLVSANEKVFESASDIFNADLKSVKNLLKVLFSKKLLKTFTTNKNISFEFKNEQVKLALLKVGNVLELFVTTKALQATDKKGEKLYNDVMTGVTIDWDGEIPQYQPNIENEIDVLAMKDLTPIFISCKNGDVEVDELYKLNTVAMRFGGTYAKKVLIAPNLVADGGKDEACIRRCTEMNILLINNKNELTVENAKKTLSSIIGRKNTPL